MSRVFCVAALLAAIPAMAAQSADAYFHRSAGIYVEGRLQEALLEAREGLRLHPGDSKLETLAEQIEKLLAQQRQDQQPGQGDKPLPQDREPEPDSSGQQPPRDDAPGEQEPDTAGRQPPPPADTPGADTSAADSASTPPPRGEMSQEEAERLLDAFEDAEKDPMRKQTEKRGKGRTGTDW